ncbi:hypothetical protein C8Q76DRAFT_570885, partial [Earliella scabrosa]
MRIDGTTRALSMLDSETGALLLRRLHPRIASYNDLIIFLMKCNMDIKFIGSGEAAKALLCYITDYITKPSLAAHVGLGALSYAIQRTNEKFPHMAEENKSRGALTLTVNRMLSRQEISHQQVMSYLVGGGDVYTSHSFRLLHWGSFDRLFRHHFKEYPAQPESRESNVEEETFVLRLQPGSISATNQQQDYVYRSTEPEFDRLPLYEFVGMVEKISRKYSASGQSAMTDSTRGNMGDLDAATQALDGNQRTRRGRKPLARGLFSSTSHTQYETHCLRKRGVWIVPVVLGDRIPRLDRDTPEKEAWARMMLILFVPWRSPSDLRNGDETWLQAFDRQSSYISERHMQIIRNMNVLSECRDVRDAHREMRRAEALAFMRDGLPGEGGASRGGHDDPIGDGFELFDKADTQNIFENVDNGDALRVSLDNMVGSRARHALDVCYGQGEARSREERPRDVCTSPVRTEDDDRTLFKQHAIMRVLRGQRRPAVDPPPDKRPAKRRRFNRHVEEEVSREVLNDIPETTPRDSTEAHDELSAIIERVVEEMGLKANKEQERAFRLVANHVKNPHNSRQLLMYIAGVGGTGKTHVVKSILRLFELLNR